MSTSPSIPISLAFALSCSLASATTFQRGDIALMGLNTNTFACGGLSAGEDQISFVAFQDITSGTTIDITDNGFERCNAGQWGDSEGAVRMTRTGGTILKGTVITWRFTNTSGAGNVVPVMPDANWSCVAATGFGNALNMNSGGDQLFFMQGGVWTNPAGAHNATYSGTVLYAFSSNFTTPWTALCGGTPTDNQRSNLPPGIDCFAMAPTAVSDFAKYTGPVTPNNQRGWLIDIDTPANWTTYTSCGNYNAGGINYAGGYSISVTAGFTNGLWRGNYSSNWFDCRNWDDAEVPTTSTPVNINPVLGSSSNCIVGINVSTPSTAVCLSLLVATAGTARNLIVDNGRVLNVSGNAQVVRTAGTGPVGITITNGTFTTNNLTLIGTGTGLNQAFFRNEAPANTVNLSGNLQISAGGYLDLQGAATGGTINLSGNYTNNDAATAFDQLYSTINFNGTGPQSINTLGSFTENFGSLSVAKSTNDLTLNAPTTISGALTLVDGRIFSTTNLLTMQSAGTTTGANNSSFVHGPMEKLGNTDFTFPIGKGNNYRPCSVTSITGVATDGFQAEYFNADPHMAWGIPLEPTLDHISECEYWTIDRSVGTPNAWVYLSWDSPISCGVTFLPDLRVARWNGLLWEDRGNGDVQGNTISGIVAASGQQSSFSPWTLASISSQNPLPIELMWFTALPDGKDVKLEWATATERNNDFFTVERSIDAVRYEPILTRDGAGDSWSTIEYADLDRTPLPGVSYYRLKQTDFDGSSTYSDPVVVNRALQDDQVLSVFSDGNTWMAVHGFPMGSTMEVLDMTGRLVWNGAVTSEGRTPLPLDGLNTGAYVLRLIAGERVESTRFTR